MKQSERRDNVRPQMPADVRTETSASGHGAKSDMVRERAIIALLSEKTFAKAAKRCGVNEKTLRRWILHDELFKRELGQARHAVYQAGMLRVQALAGQAIDTLVTLTGRSAPPAVRLGAARTVAELAMHQHDADTIVRRIEELEQYQQQKD
jgi:hypothetical protein